MKPNTQPMSGFMELTPEMQMRFNEMYETIQRVYQRYGFIPLDNPVLYRAETLLAKGGGETEQQVYRMTKGDSEIAMRYDLTVPLAIYVAERKDQLVFPFRRYAMQKVWRGERPQAGRFREFYQCDIDVIGRGTLDMFYDAEIPSVIYSVFKELDFGPFIIRVNNRRLLNGFFASLNLSEQAMEIMRIIDKLEKIGEAAVTEELVKLGLSADSVALTLKLVAMVGGVEVLAQLAELNIDNPIFAQGLVELEQLMTTVKSLGVPDEYIQIDLSIARGLDYYTGTVYETKLVEHPEIGSVCSGGRYDDLTGQYVSESYPGVGISIGLSRLFDQLSRLGKIESGASTPTRVIVLPMVEDMAPALKLAAQLRGEGIPSEVYPYKEGDKLKKKLQYASDLGIPYSVFIGTDEIAKGTFTVKNMTTGEQTEVSAEELIALVNHV